MIFKREPLTSEQAERLVLACDEPLERLLVVVLLDCGLRLAELLGLTRDRLDGASQRLIVLGKGGRRRVVATTPRAWTLLSAWFAVHDRIPASPRTVQRRLRALAVRAGIPRPVTPHVLRHTYAISMLRRGLALPSLQRLLGHQRLTTTEIYLNVSNEEACRDAERLGSRP